MTGKIKVSYYRVRGDPARLSLQLGWCVSCFPKKVLELS